MWRAVTENVVVYISRRRVIRPRRPISGQVYQAFEASGSVILAMVRQWADDKRPTRLMLEKLPRVYDRSFIEVAAGLSPLTELDAINHHSEVMAWQYKA